MKIYKIKNPTVLRAVEEFNKKVNRHKHFALTTVWNVKKEPDTCQSNFSSALMGEESFAYAVAEMIRIAAKNYNIAPKELVGKVIDYIEE